MLPDAETVVAALSVGFGMQREWVKAKILAAPLVRIAGARDGALVRLHGVASAHEDGAVTGPFSGQPALVVRTTFRPWQSDRATMSSSSWRGVTTETTGRDFVLEDGSGGAAVVRAAGLVFRGTEEVVVDVPPDVDEPDPAIEAYLVARSSSVEHVRSPGLSPRRRLLGIEERLHASQEAWVIGRVVRLGVAGDGAYRSSFRPEIEVIPAFSGWIGERIWSGLYVTVSPILGPPSDVGVPFSRRWPFR